MPHGPGDQVRVVRLGDVEPGTAPGVVARWEVIDTEPAVPEVPAGSAARVAAFTGPGIGVDDDGCAQDSAAVADLTSAPCAAEAPVAVDLAAASEFRPAVAGSTARLGDVSRAGGRARSGPSSGPSTGPSTGPSAEPGGNLPPGRRSGDDARSRPQLRTSTSADPLASTGPTSANDTAPETDRTLPPRRSGPRLIDPDADPVTAAREICLRLLTDRARTRHELAQALSRRGVPDDAATSVLERFDDVGLIDDTAFAGQWVRSRHNHRGLARRAIAMELRRKGVDDEVASEALERVDADSEFRRARELVDRKLRSLTVYTPERRVSVARRLVGMLARKGYGAATAYGVVREALAAHGAEDDELGPEPADE